MAKRPLKTRPLKIIVENGKVIWRKKSGRNISAKAKGGKQRNSSGRILANQGNCAISEKIKTAAKLLFATPEEKQLAERIISSLRQGVVPTEGVLRFSVGREAILSLIQQDLNFVRNGNSQLRLVDGIYGSGKTHILKVLQEYAYSRHFATSFITLTARECPMYDLSIVYEHIVKGIRVSKFRQSPALQHILEEWFLRIRSLGLGKERRILRELGKLSLDFKIALTRYRDGANRNDWEGVELVLRWLQGDIRTKRETRSLGIKNYASEETALEMLGNITRMLCFLGYNGLAILLDEAEAIPSLSRILQRKQAYENLERLMNCSTKTPNSYFVYATTPYFFDEAENEIGVAKDSKKVIELYPLPESDLKKLAIEIRNLHWQAYTWENISRVDNENLAKFVRNFISQQNREIIARNFVRTLVSALDVCQEHPQMRLSQILKER
ncbi:MAG TPA: hypothetical protein ENI23_06875 [bacterium]|nr:hypothetical protein [bacterium]